MTLVDESRIAGGRLTGAAAADPIDMRSVARRRFDSSNSVTTDFFEAEADSISSAALAMASRFKRGGRLLVFGEGAAATDAQHVSVEFLHPVVVGKRALPAIALTHELPGMSAGMGSIAGMVRTLGRIGDIALALHTIDSSRVAEALHAADSIGMLTISVESAYATIALDSARFRFIIPSFDPMVAQEVGETLYHVLWELVHLFMEHGSDGETR